MNRKFVLMVFVLLVGAIFLTACQSEVGARITNLAKKTNDGSKTTGSTGTISSCYCTNGEGACKIVTTTVPVKDNHGNVVGERSFQSCGSDSNNPCGGSCVGSTEVFGLSE